MSKAVRDEEFLKHLGASPMALTLSAISSSLLLCSGVKGRIWLAVLWTKTAAPASVSYDEFSGLKSRVSKPRPGAPASLESQLFAAGFADAMRRPLWLPHQVNFHFTYLRNAEQAVIDLFEDESAGWALRRSQGHGDFDSLARPCGRGVGIGLAGDVVDQSQVDEIEFDLGVEAVAEGVAQLFAGQKRKFERQLGWRPFSGHD